MRPSDLSASQRELLHAVARGIDKRLDIELLDGAVSNEANVALRLRQAGHASQIEVPATLIAEAQHTLAARDTLRRRLKIARDRMLFRPPPVHIGWGKQPEPVEAAGFGPPRGGPHRGGFRHRRR